MAQSWLDTPRESGRWKPIPLRFCDQFACGAARNSPLRTEWVSNIRRRMHLVCCANDVDFSIGGFSNHYIRSLQKAPRPGGVTPVECLRVQTAVLLRVRGTHAPGPRGRNLPGVERSSRRPLGRRHAEPSAAPQRAVARVDARAD